MKPESSSFQKVVAVTGRNVDGYPSMQTPAWSRLARAFPRSRSQTSEQLDEYPNIHEFGRGRQWQMGAEWRIEANWPRRYGQLAINSWFDQPQPDGFNNCAGPV